MMQMTMMATPNINKELHYLNKEDRLLRWLLVKHRNTQYGIDFFNEEQTQQELSRWPQSHLYDDEFHHVDPEEYDNSDDEEYQVEEGKKLE